MATLTDVKGMALLLEAMPEQIGLVQQWFFCLNGPNNVPQHFVLNLRELRVTPAEKLEPEMSHAINLMNLREPFTHTPSFYVGDLEQAMDRRLCSFQLSVEGSDEALRKVLYELAEDVLSGVLATTDLDEWELDTWQEYIDYYSNKYGKGTVS